ncbi:MAG: hypothetical protein WBG50_11660 [Desulfomonilaceae bacterium]
MIYDCPKAGSPLQQGDIFRNIPCPKLDDKFIEVFGEDENILETTWEDFAECGEQADALVTVTPVIAIVGTQSCDALRSPEITLFEIKPFVQVTGEGQNIESPSKWEKIITKSPRINQKWFYLPPDATLNFKDRMAADFRLVVSVPRQVLVGLRAFRIGRLKNSAAQHFRERVGEFFRRFPYDEWYPLTRVELDAYKKRQKMKVRHFSWQK